MIKIDVSGCDIITPDVISLSITPDPNPALSWAKILYDTGACG